MIFKLNYFLKQRKYIMISINIIIIFSQIFQFEFKSFFNLKWYFFLFINLEIIELLKNNYLRIAY